MSKIRVTLKKNILWNGMMEDLLNTAVCNVNQKDSAGSSADYWAVQDSVQASSNF